MIALGAGVLADGAVFVLLCAYQGDLAVIYLGLHVDYLKDALRARKGGEQGGHLLGDLAHGLGDLPAVLEVDRQTAQV